MYSVGWEDDSVENDLGLSTNYLRVITYGEVLDTSPEEVEDFFFDDL